MIIFLSQPGRWLQLGVVILPVAGSKPAAVEWRRTKKHGRCDEAWHGRILRVALPLYLSEQRRETRTAIVAARAVITIQWRCCRATWWPTRQFPGWHRMTPGSAATLPGFALNEPWVSVLLGHLWRQARAAKGCAIRLICCCTRVLAYRLSRSIEHRAEMNDTELSWWCSGSASDSWSKGRWCDSRPGRYQVN